MDVKIASVSVFDLRATIVPTFNARDLASTLKLSPLAQTLAMPGMCALQWVQSLTEQAANATASVCLAGRNA